MRTRRLLTELKPTDATFSSGRTSGLRFATRRFSSPIAWHGIEKVMANKNSLLRRLRIPAATTPLGAVFRGMATLMAGSMTGRLIALASTPIITRLFGPSDFAVYAVYVAAIALLLPLSSLRYVVALPLPRRDSTAFMLLCLSGGLSIVFITITAIILLLGGDALLGALGMELLSGWQPILIVGLATAAATELLSQWMTRMRNYRSLSINEVVSTTVSQSSKIGLGAAGTGATGMVVGLLASQVVALGLLTWQLRLPVKAIGPQMTISRFWLIARYYSAYPLYRLPSQFLLVLAMQAPILITTALYDAEVTGQLSLTLTVLALPISIMGATLGRAYYAEIAKLGPRRAPEVLEVTKRVQGALLGFGVIPTIILYLFGAELFSLAFGQPWRMAGEFASILSIFLLLQFISAPLMHALNVFNAQLVYLMINFSRVLGVIIVASYCRVVDATALTFVTIYGYCMVLMYACVVAIVFAVLHGASRRVESERQCG